MNALCRLLGVLGVALFGSLAHAHGFPQQAHHSYRALIERLDLLAK